MYLQILKPLNLLGSRQHHHALDVVRLREEIKGLDTVHGIRPPPVVLQDVADISSLGVDIARHIHDPLRRKVEQLVQEGRVAALARRVDDQRGVGAGEGDFREDCFGVADEEGRVLDVVCGGVVARRDDAVLVDVDADDLVEALAAGDGEEPAAAVGVDEVFGGGGFGGAGGVAGGLGDGEVEVFADVVGELEGGQVRLWLFDIGIGGGGLLVRGWSCCSGRTSPQDCRI